MARVRIFSVRRTSEATAASTGFLPRVDRTVRRARSAPLPADILPDALRGLEDLQRRLTRLMGIRLRRMETPVVNRYRRGDFFRPHVDDGRDRVRKVSIVIGLSTLRE